MLKQYGSSLDPVIPAGHYSRPGQGQAKATRKALALGFLMIIALSLVGCRPGEVQKTLNPQDLRGKRIGVILGYSSDYVLTNEYEGVEIRRFDNFSDMILALHFRQVDAAAMEMDEAYVFCRLQPEYMIYGTFVENEPYSYILNPKNQELNDQFNSWLAGFRETDTYADIIRRVKESAERAFPARYIENEGSGDNILRVQVYDGWEPVSYVNTGNNRWEGADVEVMIHFANSLGAGVEFFPTGSWTQALLDLSSGKVDIFACPESIKIKTDIEMGETIKLSDPVWDKEIVFLVKRADYE